MLGVVAEGYRIRWIRGQPVTPHRGKNPPTDEAGKAILDQEVAAMLTKGAIRAVPSSENEVVSGYFARPKKTPGKWRPIVSLKYTNSFIVYQRFKMCTPQRIKRWVRPNFWFVSIDLTDAYFCIPLAPAESRFTRFRWREVTYEYLCIMFGLGPSARVFTKVLGPALQFLRATFEIDIVAYLDDLLIQAEDQETCARHAHITVLLLQCLGYGVNFAKSSLTPARHIEHLGFAWDSVGLTVSLPQVKRDKIRRLAEELLTSGGSTGDQLRSLLGTLESTKLVTTEAPLHYRGLQAQMPKTRGGKHFPGKKFIVFRRAARLDLAWWASSFPLPQHTSTSLLPRSTTVEMWTDASGLFGWGGHDSRGQFAQGEWEGSQRDWHINLKELESARMTLDRLMRAGDTVSLSMDSTAAVAFVNKQGGTRSRLLCSSALKLWHMVLARGGWIQAHWVPREANEQADLLSKSGMEVWDFGLLPEVASGLFDRWFRPSADLFASSTFHQAGEYFSCYQDSGAARRDAFAVASWPQDSYAFPPPPLLPKVLEKIKGQGVTLILVAPRWTAAAWWSTLLSLTKEGPVSLGRAYSVCQARQGCRLPRLGRLVACLVDGARVRDPA